MILSYVNDRFYKRRDLLSLFLLVTKIWYMEHGTCSPTDEVPCTQTNVTSQPHNSTNFIIGLFNLGQAPDFNSCYSWHLSVPCVSN